MDGVEPPPGEDFHRVDYAGVDQGFFQAADLEIVSGRGFTDEDTPDGERVVVVNEAFSRRFFPGENAVGQTMRVWEDEVRIVGVVATAKIRYLGEEPRPFVYDNFEQNFRAYVTLVASTGLDPAVTSTRMLEEARALDPREAGALAVSGFALLALILASVGLYGVVSYAVSRRVREVGIRISVGAEPGAVVRMLTMGGMRLVAVGGAVGLGLSALLAQLLSRLLYGVPALDPVTFVGVPLVLGTVALMASWVPARRASRMDPVTALRSE